MTTDASGVGLMPLGTAATNCLRFFGGTAFKETMNIYRDSDSSGLTIASRTSAVSTNKTYPLLKLVSTIDPSNLGTGSGIAATTDDLFRIDWNDKPGGFPSRTHRLCFDIGITRPYYSGSGFPHTFGLATSANCFSINVNDSGPNPTGDCLYIISDTINKMLHPLRLVLLHDFANSRVSFDSCKLKIMQRRSGSHSTTSTPFCIPQLFSFSAASSLQLEACTKQTARQVRVPVAGRNES